MAGTSSAWRRLDSTRTVSTEFRAAGERRLPASPGPKRRSDSSLKPRNSVLFVPTFGSATRAAYRCLQLDRDSLMRIFTYFGLRPLKRATFCSILNATRFRFYDGRQCSPAPCFVTEGCVAEEPFEHLRVCSGLPTLPSGRRGLRAFLFRLIPRAATVSPKIPAPVRPSEEVEIVSRHPQGALSGESVFD